MVKFKVGDRVSLTGKKRTAPGFSGIRKITGSKEGFLWGDDGDENYKGIILEVNGGWYAPDALKLESSVHAIQLNHQYTSKNGQKWECIAVRGDTAWLAGIFDGVADGAAYMYKLDGSAVCLASGSEKYDIRWEPVVEWVEDGLAYDTNDRQIYSTLGDVKINVRFPLIDGEPDFTQATITRA